MKLKNETVVLLNAKLMDLKALASIRSNLSDVPVASASNFTQELGELLKDRLGTSTTGQTEIDLSVRKTESQIQVFIQLNKTVSQLTDLAGEEVDLSSLTTYFGVLKGKIKSALDLSDDDFKLEETV